MNKNIASKFRAQRWLQPNTTWETRIDFPLFAAARVSAAILQIEFLFSQVSEDPNLFLEDKVWRKLSGSINFLLTSTTATFPIKVC